MIKHGEQSNMEACSIFLGLPSDLLLRIVEISDRPLQTYIQLLSLSHIVRLNIRGIPRELSFDDDHKLGFPDPKPTADALAALIGPCKTLAKLSFRSDGSPFHPNVYGCGRTEAACAGWVDEAFGGHDRLAVLEYLPTTCEPVIERILLRLPGLVALRLSKSTPISTHLLTAIARSCPRLQALRSDCDRIAAQADVTALAPLAGSLQQFRFRHIPASARLDAFVSDLRAVSTLHLHRCRPAALEPLAAHLTRLSIDLTEPEELEEDGSIACRYGSDDDDDEATLPGPWLARLERLSLGGCRTFAAPLVRLLAANQATLRRLKLEIIKLEAPGPASMLVALDGLPRLTHLELICRGLHHRDADLTAALSPALLDRLERLTLGLHDALSYAPHPIRITSGRLICLRLQRLARVESISLDCPALAELHLPRLITSHHLRMNCPRLRMVRDLPAWFTEFTVPMPDLWSGSMPHMLPVLCACASLVNMYLNLDMVQLPNPLVLRLPGPSLESLQLSHRKASAPFELQVEAPGLRSLFVGSTSLGIRLKCPSLVTLRVMLGGSDDGGHLTSLELDDRTRLRSLTIHGTCETASLLGVLGQPHGVRLHHVGLRSPAERAWPQLAAALGMLPRLASLELDLTNAPSPLSLACPQLRTFTVHELVQEHKLVLTCPLLETLSGFWDASRVELTPTGPRSTLCGVYRAYAGDLDEPCALI
ncbi:hypothetical protein PAPYR_564 [Paratrimastix pyriformis]|uniref:F-box domain-containing protein n=1 Tax=Paratrimastix pyriformis TaxID=342808 RepID=A0ABQ8UTX6_9EUKA|nr:hypothetical protein PAPYR_564 [Paratrimastix pyriformis]